MSVQLNFTQTNLRAHLVLGMDEWMDRMMEDGSMAGWVTSWLYGGCVSKYVYYSTFYNYYVLLITGWIYGLVGQIHTEG